jgi:putative transposase
MVERQGLLSLRRQCVLLGLSRAALYYRPVEISAYQLELMALVDRQYLRTPFYGARRLAAWLRTQGHAVTRKRVKRLMQLMGLAALYQRLRTSRPAPEHRIYPYLLRGLVIERINQVWAADICYIPMARGFLYLVAVMDWVSRYVLAWRLSNLLDTSFCVAALEEALSKGRPEIFNTDQGSQFTDEDFTSVLHAHEVAISMDGRGRFSDNIFVERLWRSLKYEEVYLRAYESVAEARQGIASYFEFYNNERLHQALGYRAPRQLFERTSVPLFRRGGKWLVPAREADGIIRRNMGRILP